MASEIGLRYARKIWNMDLQDDDFTMAFTGDYNTIMEAMAAVIDEVIKEVTVIKTVEAMAKEQAFGQLIPERKQGVGEPHCPPMNHNYKVFDSNSIFCSKCGQYLLATQTTNFNPET